jgi:hypothetical protein
MKNLKIAILAIGLACFVTACGFGKRHTTIIENSNNDYIKIEYAGNIYFNSDGSAIKGISPGGYVKYRHKDKKLEAENNGTGGVSYELYDDNQKLDLDDNGRRFIAEAVKEMIKKGHYPNFKQN